LAVVAPAGTAIGVRNEVLVAI